MYSTLFITSKGYTQIPLTRLLSYAQFCSSGNKRSIQKYILKLLSIRSSGLTCREISNVSGIEVQSLTAAINSLQRTNSIVVGSIKKSSVSNRLVQVYTIVSSKNSGDEQ